LPARYAAIHAWNSWMRSESEKWLCFLSISVAGRLEIREIGDPGRSAHSLGQSAGSPWFEVSISWGWHSFGACESYMVAQLLPEWFISGWVANGLADWNQGQIATGTATMTEPSLYGVCPDYEVSEPVWFRRWWGPQANEIDCCPRNGSRVASSGWSVSAWTSSPASDFDAPSFDPSRSRFLDWAQTTQMRRGYRMAMILGRVIVSGKSEVLSRESTWSSWLWLIKTLRESIHSDGFFTWKPVQTGFHEFHESNQFLNIL
jgi:hypothetical protein